MCILHLAAMLLTACGDAAQSGFSTGPAATSVSASTGSSGTVAGTSSSGPIDDDSAGNTTSTTNISTGTLRDVGSAPDFGPSQPSGCKGKVDLLFVISHLGTMSTEQEQLVASFPGFVDTIKDTLADFDVLVVHDRRRLDTTRTAGLRPLTRP